MELATLLPSHGAEADEDACSHVNGGAVTTPLRTVLTVVCLLTVGQHVGKHFISSLGPAVMERLSISRVKYGLLFSVQELPGAVLPVTFGLAISTMHLAYGTTGVSLAATIFAGQALSAAAVHVMSYRMLLLGYASSLGPSCMSLLA
jgi:hypothetical protein